MAGFIRGMVKTVFILCYIAFMAASISHLAVFFGDFEPDKVTWGSYALAGAFDVTALVTTIGVMFFRRSMPTWVFCIVWIFIAAIAAYSYVINLEYTSHYQDMTLLMQPTGDATPVYDSQGILHYVPVMYVNTSLMWINPFLASGFTVFSLVYSVVAEFFGTKPPSVDELIAEKEHLKGTVDLVKEIAELKARNRKPGIIARTKATAKEAIEAVKEVAQVASKSHLKDRVTEPLSQSQDGMQEASEDGLNTGEIVAIQTPLIDVSDASCDGLNTGIEVDVEAALTTLSRRYPRILQWRSISGVSVSLTSVKEVTGKHHKTVQAALLKGTLKRLNRYPDKVLLTSVLAWLLKEEQEASNNGFKEVSKASVEAS
jgi:hypothetical protein